MRKKGHLAVKCRDKGKEGNRKTDSKSVAKRKGKHSNKGNQNFLEDDVSESLNNLFNIKTDRDKPITINAVVEENNNFSNGLGITDFCGVNKILSATQGIIAFKTKQNVQNLLRLFGNKIIPKGILKVNVEYKNKKYELDLYVLPGENTPIMGRDWLDKLDILKINSDSFDVQINSLNNAQSTDDVLKKHKDVFTDKAGKCNSHKLSLTLKENAKQFVVNRGQFHMRYSIS